MAAGQTGEREGARRGKEKQERRKDKERHWKREGGRKDRLSHGHSL